MTSPWWPSKRTAANIRSRTASLHLSGLRTALEQSVCMLRAWPRPLTSRCAGGLCSTVLALVLDAQVMTDGRAADLAIDSAAVMYADGRAAAALEFASYAAVLADEGAAAALALASLAAVLADGGAAAALAFFSYAVVLTDACAPAFCAWHLIVVFDC